MAISPNDNFIAGQILTATECNQFPRGIVAFASRATAYAPTTAESDLFSVTFTAVANRYYRYSLFAGGADSSAALLLTTKLTDGANVALNNSNQNLRGPGLLDLVTHVSVRTETAGSVTRKIRMVTSTGNASMGSATFIITFVVEDLGLS